MSAKKQVTRDPASVALTLFEFAQFGESRAQARGMTDEFSIEGGRGIVRFSLSFLRVYKIQVSIFVPA